MAPTDLQERALSECTERYLWRFGFRPPKCRPVVAFQVKGHSEVDGHTLYNVLCKIRREPASGPNSAHGIHEIDWTRQVRLADLREQLHDPLKDAMPEKYKRIFQNTPFASRGGAPGTTDRLDAWMSTLATWCNTEDMEASTVSLILRFLQPPVPDSSERELFDTFGRCEKCDHHTGSFRLKACRVCLGLEEETLAEKFIRSVNTIQSGLRVAKAFQAAGDRRLDRERLAAGKHSGGGGYHSDEHPSAQQQRGGEELRALGEIWPPSTDSDAEEFRGGVQLPFFEEADVIKESL